LVMWLFYIARILMWKNRRSNCLKQKNPNLASALYIFIIRIRKKFAKTILEKESLEKLFDYRV